MIDNVVAALGLGLNLTDEEIADVLWLAVQMQQFGDGVISEQGDRNEALENSVSNRASPKQPAQPLRSDDRDRQDENKKDEQNFEVHSKNAQNDDRSTRRSDELQLKIPDARSLQKPLELARSLRPLMRRVPSQVNTLLDEEATVRRIAEEKIWCPVLRPALEPWLDLALVIDDSGSMLMWRHTIAELQHFLSSYGVFRDVRVWRLGTDKAEKVCIYAGATASDRNGSPRSPSELIEANGRGLVLVVSDCIAPIWRNGAIASALQIWSRSGMVAILQMLPDWLWGRTALGRGVAAQFSALAAGIPNYQLTTTTVSTWYDIDLATSIKIPVVTLEPDKFTAWAEMLAGKGGAWSAGIVFEPELFAMPEVAIEFDGASELDAEDRVQSFRLTASPIARRLAGLLAAAPVISLPIVRILQSKVLTLSQPVHVAEVFLGGLLKPLSEITAKTNPNYVQYDFIEGVRDLLLESVPSSEIVNVVAEVSEYIAERLGISLEEFGAIIRNPQEVENIEILSQTVPFAILTAKILKRLGGEYVRFAESLELNIADSNINVSDSSISTNNCSVCDYKNIKGVIFCEQCGSELESSSAEIATTVVPVTETVTSTTYSCSICSYQNPLSEKYCLQCGNKLESSSTETTTTAVTLTVSMTETVTDTTTCPTCLYQNPLSEKYCLQCGSKLESSSTGTATTAVPLTVSMTETVTDTTTCPTCLSQNPFGEKYCLQCGDNLDLNTFQDSQSLPNGSLLQSGRYRIKRAINRGGFAICYESDHLLFNKKYFIKELFPSKASRSKSKVKWSFGTSFKERDKEISSFIREANIILKCIHPNIVRVYDWFKENDTVYIVMDFIEGKSLQEILDRQESLSMNKIKDYFIQIAKALRVIHSNGILHRDVKPGNIIIDESDRAILVDFGTAREYEEGVTGDMTVILTPGYAPLEQYGRDQKRTASADIYSLCASMYHLVTGQVPLPSFDRAISYNNSSSDMLVPPRQIVPDIDPDIEQIILKGMQMSWSNRFQTVDEFIDALNSAQISPQEQNKQKRTSSSNNELINKTALHTVMLRVNTIELYSWTGQFSLIGDRNVGKTTYLAALASLKSIPTSIIQRVNPINKSVDILFDLVQNFIAQGLQLPPTEMLDINYMNQYGLRIVLKKQFSWKNLLNAFKSESINLDLDVFCKDYAGEFFSRFINEYRSNPSIFKDYIKDISNSQGFLLLIDSQSQRDKEQAETIYELLRAIDLKTESNLRRRVAVVLTKSDLLPLPLNKYNPKQIFSSRFPLLHKQLQAWQKRGNQVEYFFSSAFGFLDKRFSEPNVSVIKNDFGSSYVIKDPSRWTPYGLVSPIYWLCTGERYKELDLE